MGVVSGCVSISFYIQSEPAAFSRSSVNRARGSLALRLPIRGLRSDDDVNLMLLVSSNGHRAFASIAGGLNLGFLSFSSFTCSLHVHVERLRDIFLLQHQTMNSITYSKKLNIYNWSRSNALVKTCLSLLGSIYSVI